jgi:hypothetical protein
MNKQQLELVFDDSANFRPLLRPSSRRQRARWWFQQMHRVVDAALDWRPTPPARPEQGHLKLAA